MKDVHLYTLYTLKIVYATSSNIIIIRSWMVELLLYYFTQFGIGMLLSSLTL